MRIVVDWPLSFCSQDGGEWNGRLALFQLPTHLPWKPEHKPKTKTKTHAAPAAGGDGFTPASVADQRDDPDQCVLGSDERRGRSMEQE